MTSCVLLKDYPDFDLTRGQTVDIAYFQGSLIHVQPHGSNMIFGIRDKNLLMDFEVFKENGYQKAAEIWYKD